MASVPQKPGFVPQVFDDEGRRVVRPDVLSLIFLSNIAAQSARIAKGIQLLHDHQLDLAGEGLTRRIVMTVSSKLEKLYLPEKWQSFTLTNDGPDEVIVWINSLYTQDIPVAPYETLNYDAKTHKIYLLYLQCTPGKSASVRIIGSY